jgi:membrane protein DedA with SNARE-associated domain
MLTHLVDQIIATMGSVPQVAVYAIVALWVGVDDAGIPVPMEPVLLFTGTLAATGKTVLILAVLSTAVGALIFASLAYTIGRRVGTANLVRVGRRIGLTAERADHLELWLRKRGLFGIIIAAGFPVLRTFSAYIMGVVGVSRARFTAGVLTASLVYCTFWLVLGSLLGSNYRAALRVFDSVGLIGLALALLAVIALMLLHNLWGRYGLRHVKRHYHRHQAAAIASGTSNATGAQAPAL